MENSWLRAAPVLLALSATAQAGLIDIGSTLVFGGANAPDTYSATTTFSSTPVLVDHGAVQIWQQQLPTAGGGEWDIFYMKIVNGGPLANDIDGLWNVTMNYTLSQAADFDGNVLQWLVNGTPVSPINNFLGICCASATNPAISGPAYYNSGFTDDLPAGTQMNWQEVFASPYNVVSEGGIDPSTANELIFALHFDPLQSSTPEPAPWLLLGGGLALLGLIGRRRLAKGA